jgi:hypothetical protein
MDQVDAEPAGKPAGGGRARTPHASRNVGSRIGGIIFFVLAVTAVAAGWLSRGEKHLTAESGVGYALGIIGGTTMLIMLLYSARKRYRFMQGWGPVRYWFRIHMAFGILGPAFILFHANFGLGSLNSNIALWCMLLVAISGLVGRYIYTRIHYGLYGARANLKSLLQDAEQTRGQLATQFPFAAVLSDRLLSIERQAVAAPKGILHSVFRVIFLGLWTRRMRGSLVRVVKSSIKAEAKQLGWTARARRRELGAARRYIDDYMKTVRKVAELDFFERLFALWHVVHIPFFIMMLLSSIVHVFAVHMY